MIHPTHETGYRPCACRDCFETAIGGPGAMCHDCEDAGCEGERECLASGAYGGELEEPEPTPAEAIRAACAHAGFFVITEGANHPATVLGRLGTVLAALDPAAHEQLAARATTTIPAEALSDELHAFWETHAADAILGAYVAALAAVAPEGCTFCSEGAWSRIGFFR